MEINAGILILTSALLGVGANETKAEGDMVGMPLGDRDGSKVGGAVGVVVEDGTSLGDSVDGDGAKVVEGTWLGISVGTPEGASVGTPEGASEGASEGTDDGGSVILEYLITPENLRKI